MTDEEKVALKAEVVAEVGRHLDEHYVKLSDIKSVVAPLLEALFTEAASSYADVLDRLLDVETLLALQDVHRRTEATDGQKWMFVATLRDEYAKKVRARMADWVDRMEGETEPVSERLRDVLPQLKELFR